MKILNPPVNCSGIYQTTESGLIVDAADYYRIFYHSALQAQRYILLTGWQFDSEVRLLRGKEAENARGEVRLLHFLESLCNKKPELEIYILAWDYSMVFSLEREWFQDILFNWTNNERIHFRYDSRHAFGATHHQKLVIVDGLLAFVGGMDICSARWDDRNHLPENPDRSDNAVTYGSYHDIQSFHTGPVVAELQEIFKQRWSDSGAKPLQLAEVGGTIQYEVDGSLLLAAHTVAISRTQAAIGEQSQQIREIRQLYIDAINSAEQLIYMENQYFSSQAVYNALVDRMASPGRPRLQIVIMVPDQLPLTEKLFIGIQQMKMLRSLQEIAAATGHHLGIYTTVCIKSEERNMTFIHSKLLLVDDRFLSMGSANITNRSMGLDTELNVSWEEETDLQAPLIESIRKIRLSLLAEHAGLPGEEQRFRQVEGLVHYLDVLADDPDSRICRYQADAALETNQTLQGALQPIARIVDPEENVFEQLAAGKNGFSKGVKMLGQLITGL